MKSNVIYIIYLIYNTTGYTKKIKVVTSMYYCRSFNN